MKKGKSAVISKYYKTQTSYEANRGSFHMVVVASEAVPKY